LWSDGNGQTDGMTDSMDTDVLDVDLEDLDDEEEADRAPQPGNTPSPDEPPRLRDEVAPDVTDDP
jgi:hypothetical protein